MSFKSGKTYSLCKCLQCSGLLTGLSWSDRQGCNMWRVCWGIRQTLRNGLVLVGSFPTDGRYGFSSILIPFCLCYDYYTTVKNYKSCHLMSAMPSLASCWIHWVVSKKEISPWSIFLLSLNWQQCILRNSSRIGWPDDDIKLPKLCCIIRIILHY